jgi:hypothetical protein
MILWCFYFIEIYGTEQLIIHQQHDKLQQKNDSIDLNGWALKTQTRLYQS